jgi:hypothetical protein
MVKAAFHPFAAFLKVVFFNKTGKGKQLINRFYGGSFLYIKGIFG